LGCRLLAPASPVTVVTNCVALPANTVYKQDVEKLHRKCGEIVVIVRILSAQHYEVGSPHTPLYLRLLHNGVHPRVSPLSGKFQMGQYSVSFSVSSFSMFAFSGSATRRTPRHQITVLRLKIYPKHNRHLTCSLIAHKMPLPSLLLCPNGVNQRRSTVRLSGAIWKIPREWFVAMLQYTNIEISK
jgi:hypothetical protein